MSLVDKLSNIIIRGPVPGKKCLGPVSLRELLKSGQGGYIMHWFMTHIFETIGYDQGDIVSELTVINMIDYLEDQGFRFYKKSVKRRKKQIWLS